MSARKEFKMVPGNNDASHVFLMAEDDPVDAEAFSEMLQSAFHGKYSVVCVDRFTKIADELQQGNFHALILDMDLPDQSGIDNVCQLGQQFPSLPIVVLTGNEDFDLAIDTLQSGAQDYLSKNNVTPEVLARSVNYARERKQIEQRLKNALEDAAYKNVQLEAQAKHDPLTGLANRAFFNDVAERTLMQAERKHALSALLYFDLDEFKKVNDTLGHVVGDSLLLQVSKRLKEVVRDSDLLARIGGDEFVIITDILDSKEEVYPLVKRIQGQFEKEFVIGPHQIEMNSSIGIAFYPEADSLDLLIKQADCAMYEAKSDKDSSICFYSGRIATQYARTQKVESYLGKATEKNEIFAAFQPVIAIKDASTVHVEALARWHSEKLGKVAPDEFIPLAENSPVINSITHVIVKYSSEFYRSMLKCGRQVGKISINISANQLASEHFCKLFMQWLNEFNLPPTVICLELTERQIVHSVKRCKKQFTFLKSQGLKFALDDFGSGFSSFTHLLELPFDILKLDRMLIDHIDQNPRNQALVAGIVEMAKRLDMVVVAEGIEREQEKQIIVDLGCDFLQGYLFSKPLPLHEAGLLYEDIK